MNSDSKPCPIPINGTLSYQDWLQGRRSRRELGNRVAPEVIRRTSGPKDLRLKRLFNGERGLPFTPADQL